MKFARVAVLSMCAGLVAAQTDQGSRTETTTASTTGKVELRGTLVDRSCYTSHSEREEAHAGENRAGVTDTVKDVTHCPVTAATTLFGIVTPEGKVMRFDDTGNARAIALMKSKKDMDRSKPVTVRVAGTANGEVLAVKEIR